MYPAYFDGRIHEINRNVAGLLLIVALSIDLAGVLNTVTVRGPDQIVYVIILSVAVRDYNINTLIYINDRFIKTANVYKRRNTSKL